MITEFNHLNQLDILMVHFFEPLKEIHTHGLLKHIKLHQLFLNLEHIHAASLKLCYSLCEIIEQTVDLVDSKCPVSVFYDSESENNSNLTRMYINIYMHVCMYVSQVLSF